MAFTLRSSNTIDPKKTDPKTSNLTVKESTMVKVNKPIPLMSNQEKESRRQMQMKEKQGNLSTYKQQGALSKAMEIAGSPLTAFGYAARNEKIPDNFSKGPRNALDTAVDVINPVSIAKEGYNAVKETGKGIYNAAKGNFSEAGSNLASGAISALSVIPAAIEAKGLIKGAKVGLSKKAFVPIVNAGTKGTIDNLNRIIKDNELSDIVDKYGLAHPQGLGETPNSIIDKTKRAFSGEFFMKYGDKFHPKDASLYSRLKVTELGIPDPMTKSAYILGADDSKYLEDNFKLSKNFSDKHNISKDYTHTEELIGNVYSRGYDSRINKRVIPDQPIAKKFYKKEVSNKLEELVKKNKLKEEENLFRGDVDYPVKKVWRNNVKQPKNSINFKDLKVGDIWKPESFVSTSLDKKVAKNFGGTQSTIKAPKGQSVLHPNSMKSGEFPKEEEVLLPSKLKFKVEGKTIIDGFSNFKHSIVNPYTTTGAIGGSIMFNKNKK